MSEENRAAENVQPLARSVDDQQLARPVGEEREETAQTEEAQPETSHEVEEREPDLEEVQAEKGPIAKAADKAVEKGLIDESTADKAREKGLIDKAEEAVSKIRDKLTGR